MAKQSAVVVGGGIIGTSCAYYLARSGWDVTLIDQARHGQQCSHANCGLVSPSHVLPLATPGAVRKNIRLMLQKNSPFYVRPRWDPKLWFWLVRFALRCRTSSMLESGRARHALLNSSRSLYDELIREEAISAEFESQGCLFVYRSREKLESFRSENELTRREFGVAAECWDRDQLLEREPALKPDVAGAWYYEVDAHLRPDRLLEEWRRVLEEMDVRIVENCRFERFAGRNSVVKAAITEHGELDADRFVVATGAFTPMLNRVLGCKIPIQPGKGYSITMARPRKCPVYPMLCPEHKLAVTPMATAYRLGSTMEFSGYDARLNQKRLNALRQAATHYLWEPTAEPTTEEWFGWRPMTFDGKPIIDRSPRYSNVVIAAGHNMLGLSMAPATGRLVAELLNEQRPHVDLKPYRVDRF